VAWADVEAQRSAYLEARAGEEQRAGA
jgi:hypothetical protein